MAQTNDELDPELASLLGVSASPEEGGGYNNAVPPDAEEFEGNGADVDLSEKNFPEITKYFADQPHNRFNDAVAYYKEAVANTGEGGVRLHSILQKYITAKDPKDRGVFRQQLIPIFWETLRAIARQAPNKLSDPKKFLLRFAILHPQFLEQEQRNLFAKLIIEDEYNQPIYYLDEWFKAVGSGAVRNSSTDEAKVARAGSNTQQRQLLEKTEGKVAGFRNMMQAKTRERLDCEKLLQKAVSVIVQHDPLKNVSNASDCYSQLQRMSFSEIQDLLKNLLKLDREQAVLIRELEQAEYEVDALKMKVETEEAASAASVDLKAVDTEFESVRQMTKMTIGRQGNHFPILSKEYFHCGPNEISTRENIISQLRWIESIDPEAFCRYYKNKMNRIVPYVVILPNYGESGVCWEPFERFNRVSSRGRIAVPLYPKNLQIAILSAVADLRWQVAKEKAAYYWMEEGLTGYYYQYFNAKKMKGDLKETFIQDYIIWMTKESEGTQKMDKELRGIFWRYVPFAQPIKDKLKTRSFAYQELYQRDINRAMSDGY
jgi:hypothetical protein